ncbi:hypothetical protein B1R32_11453 [Abditibacterium utsteinense]|uniref:Uncharacterized protein n=1 Tax=Abditibacterium utsteinense TaxID=1960156 RepID=A0A2S8SR25_9BACT|nr:hypothetical protein [Abditibacterium utsteinense]PQV63228.1 hypothetical protein B1R32_11453 [Abditibacterium utsteinense]
MATENENENEEAAEKSDETPSFTARLVRVVRTESSEVYIIWQDDVRLGQVDLHFGWDLIHATLMLEKDLTTEQQADLVDLIDQDVVSSHLPRFAREDFLVTVFRGQELDPFSDGPDGEEMDDEEDY